jgi:hypothetical protein
MEKPSVGGAGKVARKKRWMFSVSSVETSDGSKMKSWKC